MLGVVRVLIDPERASKHKIVLNKWRDLKANHKSLEHTVLQLMRHPNATAEQLLQAGAIYRRSYEHIKLAQQRMREKYGSRAWIEDIGVQ